MIHLVAFVEGGGFFVVKSFVIGIDLACSAASRAVLIDGEISNAFFAHRLCNVVDQHLRSSYRKRWNDDAPAVAGSVFQDAKEFLHGFRSREMILVAIGGFQENQVIAVGQNRVCAEWRSRAARCRPKRQRCAGDPLQ